MRKLANNHPRVIFVTGVDGSGKTHFAKKICSELQSFGLKVSSLWLRFMNLTSKPLLGICRLTGLNYYIKDKGVVIGYHDFEKSKLVSYLFIILQLIDVWIVTIFRIWPRLLRGDTLVCDRGAYDTLIDVMVDTKMTSLGQTIIGRAFVMLLPSDHVVYLILRSPENIFSSRPDVRVDRNFDLRYELYMKSAKTFKWIIINNDGPASETLKNIIGRLTPSE